MEDLTDQEIEERYSFNTKTEEARVWGIRGCTCINCFNKRTMQEWEKIQRGDKYQTFIDYLRHMKETIKIKELAQKKYGLKFTKNKSLCPFHDDHNPSFTIDELENTFKCWSSNCGLSGDVIEFIELMEKRNDKQKNV